MSRLMDEHQARKALIETGKAKDQSKLGKTEDAALNLFTVELFATRLSEARDRLSVVLAGLGTNKLAYEMMCLLAVGIACGQFEFEYKLGVASQMDAEKVASDRCAVVACGGRPLGAQLVEKYVTLHCGTQRGDRGCGDAMGGVIRVG